MGYKGQRSNYEYFIDEIFYTFLDKTNDMMEQISVQSRKNPNRTRTTIATVPIISTDLRKSVTEVSFLMARESLVLFKTNSFFLLSIDSARVWFTYLQMQTQVVLPTAVSFMFNSVV